MKIITTQSLTLLAALVALITNILSLNEQISKLRIITFVKTICGYVIPILLIKQIILLSYETQCFFDCLFLTIALMFLVLMIKKRKLIYRDDKIIISMIFISSLFEIAGLFYPKIFQYNDEMNAFIDNLYRKTPYQDMILYLCDNLKITLFVLTDTFITILFLVVLVKEIFNYPYLISTKLTFCNEIRIDFNKFCLNCFVLLTFSSGLPKIVIAFICNSVIF